MPLYALSLLSECRVAGAPGPDPLRELAIHVVRAWDVAEACARGAELGIKRQHGYRNAAGEEVCWIFQRVVECQSLPDPEMSDGMEVSSWLYSGERLCLDEGWMAPGSEPV